MAHITIIAGGIGSGKSVVSRLLSVMGYPTYDCDSRAKWLMNHNITLKNQITALLGMKAYCGAVLDNGYVASRIFADGGLLKQINSLVHPVVKADIALWAESHEGRRCFVETALLTESGLGMMAQDVWVVDAPVDVRIERVARRSALTEAQIRKRISAQTDVTTLPGVHLIVNDGKCALLPQLLHLLN